MKIVLHPRYRHASAFVNELHEKFDALGRVRYDKRNTLKSYVVEGDEIMVKRFRVPILFNRIVYTFFRHSKARRSYEHALFLLEMGIETPHPIAYIETKKYGLIHQTYYICVFEKTANHIRAQMKGENVTDSFLRQLANFVADLHQKGILFLDLSPGNVLLREGSNPCEFLLVDINRMRFPGTLSLKMRYANFARLAEDQKTVETLAREYAAACQLDEQQSILQISKACRNFYR